jgi:hypothetical protein
MRALCTIVCMTERWKSQRQRSPGTFFLVVVELNIYWQNFAEEQVQLLADDDSDTRQKPFLAPHSDRHFFSGKEATPHEI